MKAGEAAVREYMMVNALASEAVACYQLKPFHGARERPLVPEPPFLSR